MTLLKYEFCMLLDTDVAKTRIRSTERNVPSVTAVAAKAVD